ncbi:Rieske (2Fe-2S) protein [Angustibacter luteus]|uniref:Cytochrome bc1 complex Rieske iron-sulfur subunit n=1 Tax=Angustibacter luteus TaxID=658456 RepID=A0ABW1JFW4_9ACTN
MAIEPLTRRSALTGLAVAGAAAVVGFVVARASRPDSAAAASGAANSYGADPSGGQVLATLGQVPPGGGLVLADRRIVLTRGQGDDVHAFSAVCTHQGCTVSSVADGVILCPCHSSRFDARTGVVLDGPAPRPLPPVAVTVSGDDVLTS